jgi:hypothetical protein
LGFTGDSGKKVVFVGALHTGLVGTGRWGVAGDKLATPATTDNGPRNSGAISNYLDLREGLTRDSRFNFETGAWETPWGEFKNGVSVE